MSCQHLRAARLPRKPYKVNTNDVLGPGRDVTKMVIKAIHQSINFWAIHFPACRRCSEAYAPQRHTIAAIPGHTVPYALLIYSLFHTLRRSFRISSKSPGKRLLVVIKHYQPIQSQQRLQHMEISRQVQDVQTWLRKCLPKHSPHHSNRNCERLLPFFRTQAW